MIVGTKPLEQEIRAVDWSSDGKYIVAGDWVGHVYLFDPKNLNLLEKKPSKISTGPKRQSTYWIEDIKFSPDNTKVSFNFN